MKTQKNTGLGALIAMIALIVFASGCATKGSKLAQTDTDHTPENYQGGGGVTEELPDGGYENIIFGPNGSGLATVHFDFDSAEIRPDAREILETNAKAIKKSAGKQMIQIAGHCDERGTQEYNLALGERRALAVREYLMRLGVSGDQMITISYGEEVPEDFGSSESAWAVNRRGVFNEAQQ